MDLIIASRLFIVILVSGILIDMGLSRRTISKFEQIVGYTRLDTIRALIYGSVWYVIISLFYTFRYNYHMGSDVDKSIFSILLAIGIFLLLRLISYILERGLSCWQIMILLFILPGILIILYILSPLIIETLQGIFPVPAAGIAIYSPNLNCTNLSEVNFTILNRLDRSIIYYGYMIGKYKMTDDYELILSNSTKNVTINLSKKDSNKPLLGFISDKFRTENWLWDETSKIYLLTDVGNVRAGLKCNESIISAYQEIN